MIAAALLGALAGLILWWVLADHRTDDPRTRHPSTGGAHRLNPPKQPCHVRIIRPGELDRDDTTAGGDQ